MLFILSSIYKWTMSKGVDTNSGQSQSGPRVVIGVMCDAQQFETLGAAAMRTWISDLPYKVIYIIGNNRTPELNSNLPTVKVVDTADKYPPLDKVFLFWQYLAEMIDEYDYFIQMDADAMVNPKKLSKLVQSLPGKKNSDQLYMGVPARGRESERSKLGIKAPYCQGMGYILSRNVLASIAPHLQSCRDEHKSQHSDVEIGRCIYKHTQLACKSTKMVYLMHQQISDDGVVSGMGKNSRGQMISTFPARAWDSLFSYAIIHPIKDAMSMELYYLQLKNEWRPMLLETKRHNRLLPLKYAAFKFDYDKSCSHHPDLQLSLYGGDKRQQCDFRRSKDFAITSLQYDEDSLTLELIQQKLTQVDNISNTVLNLSNIGFEKENQCKLKSFGNEIVFLRVGENSQQKACQCSEGYQVKDANFSLMLHLSTIMPILETISYLNGEPSDSALRHELEAMNLPTQSDQDSELAHLWKILAQSGIPTRTCV